MRRSLMLAMLSLGAASAAAAQPSASSTPPAGAREFQHNCAACHIGGRVGPELVKDFVIGREADVRKIILDGGVQMPGFKYMLSPREVDLIMAYMRGLDEPPTVIGGPRVEP